MNADQRVRQTIGEFVVQIAVLQAQVEELQAKVTELAPKADEPPK